MSIDPNDCTGPHSSAFDCPVHNPLKAEPVSPSAEVQAAIKRLEAKLIAPTVSTLPAGQVIVTEQPCAHSWAAYQEYGYWRCDHCGARTVGKSLDLLAPQIHDPLNVVVTEHAQPHAAQVRSIAQWFEGELEESSDAAKAIYTQWATELRAAAERLEATCSTCKWWKSDGQRVIGAQCSEPSRVIAHMTPHDFGCNLHQPLPREAPGTETKE